MNKPINPGKFILKTATLMAFLATLAGCADFPAPERTKLKDMSAQGYEYSMYQRADGTDHNRVINLFVDKMADYPLQPFNILEGSYYNTGTEAPEHLRDPLGRMIFTQTEKRRYYDFWDNARNDITNILLMDPSTERMYSATMSRLKTEWWGDSDMRAIQVNQGPITLRMEGVSTHLGVDSHRVFAVLVPEMLPSMIVFNQDNAGVAKDMYTDLAKRLEASDFGLDSDQNHVLMSTRDYDLAFDWLGVEAIPSQGKLFDGTFNYVIASSYFGPNNQLFSGRGFLNKNLYGHLGAPDNSTKAGSALDTIVLAEGTVENISSTWIPRAKMVVNHPAWSNQTEYQFYRITDNGDILMGTLQRTYNDKTQKQTDSDGDVVIIELVGTNDYLAKGDLDFMHDFLVLLGGQQISLGIDYKTSYMDYALDLTLIADGMLGSDGMDPESVASLNVDADATIENVIEAGRNIFQVEPTGFFNQVYQQQQAANEQFQIEFRKNQELIDLYGFHNSK